MKGDIVQLLRSHVSVRDYTGEALQDQDWDAILACGQQAATDATGQLYSAIDLRDAALRERVGRLAGDQAHVHSAARFLIVCLDVRRIRLLLEHRGEAYGMKERAALLFGIGDAGFFSQNLCVAAEGLGYGVCYIGGVQNRGEEIARELHLPTGVIPLWGITFGRPAHASPPKPRLPREVVVHVDAYKDAPASQLIASFDVMKAATRSGDWLNPIRKYFADGGVMQQREDGLARLWKAQGVDPD